MISTAQLTGTRTWASKAVATVFPVTVSHKGHTYTTPNAASIGDRSRQELFSDGPGMAIHREISFKILRTALVEAIALGDTITKDSQNYKVIDVVDRPHDASVYYKCEEF